MLKKSDDNIGKSLTKAKKSGFNLPKPIVFFLRKTNLPLLNIGGGGGGAYPVHVCVRVRVSHFPDMSQPFPMC